MVLWLHIQPIVYATYCMSSIPHSQEKMRKALKNIAIISNAAINIFPNEYNSLKSILIHSIL